MMLGPEVQAHLDHEEAMPDGLDIAGVRAHLRRQLDRHFEAFGQPGPAVETVEDHEVPVRGGTVTLRVYRPHRTDATCGVHLILHGGGWRTGSIDEKVCDADARHTAVGADVAVAALEYRLAPEFPYPAALYDVVAAVGWLRAHVDRLGLGAGRLSLGGNSAGANLAAAAVVADPSLRPAGLVLEVPALDLTGRTMSAAARRMGLDVGDVRPQLGGYLGDRMADADAPTASPLLAADLSGYPETWVMVAELDPLRAEGEAFAARLSAAGVAAHLTCYPGALHGSALLTGSWSVARRWRDDRVAAVRQIHHRQEPMT